MKKILSLFLLTLCFNAFADEKLPVVSHLEYMKGNFPGPEFDVESKFMFQGSLNSIISPAESVLACYGDESIYSFTISDHEVEDLTALAIVTRVDKKIYSEKRELNSSALALVKMTHDNSGVVNKYAFTLGNVLDPSSKKFVIHSFNKDVEASTPFKDFYKNKIFGQDYLCTGPF